ncbi:flavin monoamine oxidase family protein [Saccharopolyspora erythraea]|uniref:flavin monoamine oxidase family protein n=1 Tax=Saccharopolyspora erythraea TaxID=1836 RepID=UPI0031F73B0F
MWPVDRFDVVVVGAGVSGLACAAALAAAGTDVLVAEARGRTGGRLLSVPTGNWSEGGRLDLGATWFWPHETLVAGETAQLAIRTFDQHTAGNALFEASDADGAPLVQRIDGNPIDVAAGRFGDGAQSLTDSLAGLLPAGSLRLGTAVSAIRRTGDAVLVRAGTAVGGAEQVVVAVPPALAAATIDITPALPEPLLRLARATPTWMADTVKVVARYRRPFWRERGLAGAAVSHAGPLREIHDMSGSGGEPAALFGFAIAATPGSPDPALGESARRQLARLFGPEAGDPLELHVHDWSAEPFTRPPGRDAGAGHHLFGHPAYRQPALDGRLHWAGTETATHHAGHIEGALRAAARAATAVLSRRDLTRTAP